MTNVFVSGQESGVLLDELEIPSQNWTLGPESTSYAIVDVADGGHLVYHTDVNVGVSVLAYGHGGTTAEGYAYQAGNLGEFSFIM